MLGLCVAASANARSIWSDSPHHVLQLIAPALSRMSSTRTQSGTTNLPPLHSATFFAASSLTQITVLAKIFLMNPFVFAIELNRVVSFARQSSDSCGERLALGCNRAFVIVRIETEETSASKARRLSPQCLCSSPQENCREAFFYFTAQSKARSAEAVRVCWDDRNSGRSSIRKSQKRLQISLGRPKTWSETNARTLRASEPDAV